MMGKEGQLSGLSSLATKVFLLVLIVGFFSEGVDEQRAQSVKGRDLHRFS